MGIKEESTAKESEEQADNKQGILKNNNQTQSEERVGSGRNNKNNNYNPTTITSHSYDYSGENKDIGVILAMRTERYSKKVVFSIFIERLKNHVLTSFDDAKDIVELLEQRKDPADDIVKQAPKDLVNNKDSDVEKWMNLERCKRHMRRLETLENNKQTLYGLMWGQCSSGLQEVIKADDDYKKKAKDFDCVWLLEKLNLVSAGVDEKANKYSTLVRAITAFVTIRQGQSESNDSFRKRIEANAVTLELAGGGHVLYSPKISEASDKNNPKDDEKEVEIQRFKAMIMILRADPARYGVLQESLFEGVYKGRDEFPETLTAAYDLLQRIANDFTIYTTGSSRFSRFKAKAQKRLGAISFLQSSGEETDDLVPGRDGKIHPKIVCHNCHKRGHYSNQCPNNRKQFAHFTLTQNKMQVVNKHWLLLDSCSTVSVCCNPQMVQHIRECAPGQGITVLTNGGSQSFNKTADLNCLPIEVHYNAESMANILSLSDVANLEGARITMDTDVERAIVLHYKGDTLKFKECIDGLYYLDIRSMHKTKSEVTNYSSFTSTVAENKKLFTKKDVKGADSARSWQHIIGWPSETTYQHIIQNNLVNNCPITLDDLHRATLIHGAATPLLQGKMNRVKPLTKQGAQIPPSQHILKNYPNLELFTDFFFVNQLPFLLTTSSKIHFLTTQSGETRSKSAITKGLQNVINIYETRGFNITDVHGDNEFDINTLREALRPSTLHIYGAEEHVAPIERAIRTVKERCRLMCYSLPYKRYTKIMVHSLVEYVVHWLNAFPTRNGASNTMSPSTMYSHRTNKAKFRNETYSFWLVCHNIRRNYKQYEQPRNTSYCVEALKQQGR